MKVIRKLKVLIALDTENTSSLMQSDFFYRVGVMSYDVPKVLRVIRARKWLGDPARPWKKFEGGFRLCLTRWASWNCNRKMACGPLKRDLLMGLNRITWTRDGTEARPGPTTSMAGWAWLTNLVELWMDSSQLQYCDCKYDAEERDLKYHVSVS